MGHVSTIHKAPFCKENHQKRRYRNRPRPKEARGLGWTNRLFLADVDVSFDGKQASKQASSRVKISTMQTLHIMKAPQAICTWKLKKSDHDGHLPRKMSRKEQHLRRIESSLLATFQPAPPLDLRADSSVSAKALNVDHSRHRAGATWEEAVTHEKLSWVCWTSSALKSAYATQI